MPELPPPMTSKSQSMVFAISLGTSGFSPSHDGATPPFAAMELGWPTATPDAPEAAAADSSAFVDVAAGLQPASIPRAAAGKARASGTLQKRATRYAITFFHDSLLGSPTPQALRLQPRSTGSPADLSRRTIAPGSSPKTGSLSKKAFPSRIIVRMREESMTKIRMGQNVPHAFGACSQTNDYHWTGGTSGVAQRTFQLPFRALRRHGDLAIVRRIFLSVASGSLLLRELSRPIPRCFRMRALPHGSSRASSQAALQHVSSPRGSCRHGAFTSLPSSLDSLGRHARSYGRESRRILH